MVVARKTLGDLVIARLEGIAGLNVYRGEIRWWDDENIEHREPPVISTPAGPDPSGRVAPYVVHYGGAGDPELGATLAGPAPNLLWSFQTTVAAGYEPDCAKTVDQVVAQLHGWRPVHEGVSFGLVHPPIGFDPGPIRRDDQKTPPRFWLPLLWQLGATS